MSANDIYVSEIRLLAGSRLPQYWHYCDGSSLPVWQFPALFDLIGYQFGGSGELFQLPLIADRATFLRYIISDNGLRPNPNGGLSTCLISEIRYLAGLPGGCVDALPAKGTELPINQRNQFVFSILGFRYGGNSDQLKFKLPNLPNLIPSTGPAIVPLICVAGIYPQQNVFASDAYTSEVRQMALTFTPRGWLDCDGQEFPVGGYPALFSLLFSRFGGVDLQTFKVPQLQSREDVPYFISAISFYPDTD